MSSSVHGKNPPLSREAFCLAGPQPECWVVIVVEVTLIDHPTDHAP
jgi:hypothetical protein